MQIKRGGKRGKGVCVRVCITFDARSIAVSWDPWRNGRHVSTRDPWSGYVQRL